MSLRRDDALDSGNDLMDEDNDLAYDEWVERQMMGESQLEDPGHGGPEPEPKEWAGGHPVDVGAYRRRQVEIEESEEEAAEQAEAEARAEDQAIEAWLDRKEQEQYLKEAEGQ